MENDNLWMESSFCWFSEAITRVFPINVNRGIDLRFYTLFRCGLCLNMLDSLVILRHKHIFQAILFWYHNSTEIGVTLLDCVVPENVHTYPKGGFWKSQGGVGVGEGLKNQNF